VMLPLAFDILFFVRILFVVSRIVIFRFYRVIGMGYVFTLGHGNASIVFSATTGQILGQPFYDYL
jgi:hypothetical protein